MKHMVLFGLIGVAAAVVWIGCSSSPLAGRESPDSRAISAEEYAASLPKDVYPDSLNRLPLVKREDLDEKGKKAYDEALAKGNSVEGIKGVGGIRLHSTTEDVRF